MNKKRLAVKIMLALALAGAPAAAAELPGYDVEEIIVRADAYRPALAEETVNARTVSPGRAATVPYILRQSAGLDVQTRAPFGDNQDGTVKLRGFDARRYTVLVDGRPVTMAGVMGGSYVDWNAIPLDTVEKIQIIKGAKSAAHGNTLGGVINIVTRERREAGGEASALTGGQGQYRYALNYGGPSGRLTWNVHAGREGADAFLRNNDYDSQQYGVALKYAVTDKDSLGVGVRRTEARRGMIIQNHATAPGGYNPAYPVISATDAETFPGGVVPNPGAYWQKFSTAQDVSWRRATDGGYWALSYWKNEEKRREVNFTAGGALNLDRTVVSDLSSGWMVAGEAKAGGHTTGYGVEYKRLRYGYGWYTTGAGMALIPSQKIDMWGGHVEDTWALDGRWTGNVGLRYDRMAARPDANPAVRSLDAAALSPKVNFSFRNNRDMTTFLSVSRLWRAPSMAEFYWWSQNYASVNPQVVGEGLALKPEKGWGYEVGAEKRVSARYKTKLTAFYQDIEDYINFTHQFPYSCYNIPQARVWGFEWENSYRLNAASQVTLSYTNQHTRKAGVDAVDNLGLRGELDYRPRHKAALAYHYDAQPWQARYVMAYTGRQRANYPYGTAGVITLGGYAVSSLDITYSLNRDETVNLAVTNLLAKNYVEQNNYPLPGRLVSLAFRQKL